MPRQRAEMTWNGDEVSAKLRAATVKALRKWGELVGQEADALVPLDESTLQASRVVSVDEDDLAVAVSYDTPYAVKQHEDLTLNHPNGRQAKYLETPWLANKGLALQMVARECRRVTGG